MVLSPIKIRVRNWLKSARVKSQNKTQKKLGILMVLNASILVKLNMIRMNPNDSMRNVG